MSNSDPRQNDLWHTLVSGLKITPMPEGMAVRLKGISARPQARGLLASLGVFEDLSFGLRHDLRYQMAAACAAVVLSLGVWQGLTPSTAPRSTITADPEATVALMEVDPVLAGGL